MNPPALLSIGPPVRLAPTLPYALLPRSRCGPTLRAAVAAVGIAAAAACTHARPTTTPAAGGATADSASAAAASTAVGPVAVQVENRGSSEVVVYAVRGTIRQRLVTVPPVSQVTTVIPASLTNDRGGVALYARALAGGTSYTSDRIVPQLGDRLVLTLQTRLATSSLSVQ